MMMRGFSLSVLVAVSASLLLSGYATIIMSSDGKTSGDSGFSFEWAPTTVDYAYMMELTAGRGVACTAEGKTGGGFTHESGLGVVSVTRNGPTLSTGTAYRSDDSAHLGPVNTAHASGPLWADALGHKYSGSWFTWVEDGAHKTMVTAALHTDEQRENYVRVDCEGEARLRFFLADAFEPILSHTATGGAGIALGTPPLAGLSASLNMMDDYTIETTGDRVFFYLRDKPLPNPDTVESYLEGKVTLKGPEGKETIPFDLNEEGFFQALRIWTSADGEYSADLERVALHRHDQLGVLLGFKLQEELDTLGAASTRIPPKTVNLCQDRLETTSNGETLVSPPYDMESGRPIAC